jgi:hypothetical protein
MVEEALISLAGGHCLELVLMAEASPSLSRRFPCVSSSHERRPGTVLVRLRKLINRARNAAPRNLLACVAAEQQRYAVLLVGGEHGSADAICCAVLFCTPRHGFDQKVRRGGFLKAGCRSRQVIGVSVRITRQNNDSNLSEPSLILQAPKEFLARHDRHVQIQHDALR